MLLAIDANNLIHRFWYATHDVDACVDAVLATVGDLLGSYEFEAAYAAFDCPPYKRAEIKPDYKQDRKDRDPLVNDAINEAKRRLGAREGGDQNAWASDRLRLSSLQREKSLQERSLDVAQPGDASGENKTRIYCLYEQGYEADDVIATLSVCWPGKVVIFSNDKDLWQLLEAGRVMCIRDYNFEPAPKPNLKQIHTSSKRKPQSFTENDLMQQYGLRPGQWIEFQMLVGKTGQWEGARGIGEKRATDLMRAYGTLDDVYGKHGQLRVSERQRESLDEFKERMDEVRSLVQLRVVPSIQEMLKQPADV